ncbi:MAG: hypothetical protein PHS46_04030 [Candidatus Omnitrophica bacterium]|nr:hypothetical protein [Candidatus Omnitrophota bacterium]
MVRKKILLLLVFVFAIVLSCVMVALVVRYFVDKGAFEPAPVTGMNIPVTTQPASTVKNPGADVTADREVIISAETEKSGVAVAGSQSSSVVTSPVNFPDLSERTSGKLPAFTRVNNLTGPTLPSSANIVQNPANPANIMEFVPQSSVTGPISEAGGKHETLPSFIPVQSSTGPVKTEDK